MSDQAEGSAPLSLPNEPDLDWLRKQAKRRLEELRATDTAAKLADAQLEVARQYGFSSWRALKAHIDALGDEGRFFEAAKKGDLATVDQLLRRGLDPDMRESGDNTYPMHWAAAAGHLDVVKRLADAGGDVVGAGDDHQLEVIGWATCWDGCDDAAHRAIADFLVSRGARHHIFSAMSHGLEDEVRRIVARDPAVLNRRMSRNENNQLPLHFAVRHRLPKMVALLLELGADPLAVDGYGISAAGYAESSDIDRGVMEAIRALMAAELVSAERGHRAARGGALDLVASLSLQDWETAERLVRENPALIERGRSTGGALHLMAKRGDVAAVQWLLDHGTDPNALWAHFDADVTALHLASLADHPGVVPPLLAAGADPSLKDTMHHADAMEWAVFFHRKTIIEMLGRANRGTSGRP